MAKNKTIEIFEGDRAKHYDNYITGYFPDYSYVMDAIPKLLHVHLLENSKPKILVAGCGTGTEVKQIVDYNRNWNVEACDPSKEMIDLAKEKLQDYPNVTLINTTVDKLSPKPRYDVATLFLVLHFISDDGAKLSLLKAIAQRLKKDGKFMLMDICGTTKELKQNFKLLRCFYPSNWTEEDVNNLQIRTLNNLNVVSEKRTLELLNEAGFKNITKWHQSFISKSWVMTKA